MNSNIGVVSIKRNEPSCSYLPHYCDGTPLNECEQLGFFWIRNMPVRIEYLEGQRLHVKTHLEFVKDTGFRVYKTGRKRRKALFLCDCGSDIETVIDNVSSGKTISCGCAKVDHGESNNDVYGIWWSMLDRCNNAESHNYNNYGKRGIEVCDRWNDIVHFISDMGDRPEGTSIDRIDNDLGYTPENCKWSTRTEQQRNTRASRWWFINGERYESIHQASKSLNIGGTTVKRWCDGFYENGEYHQPKHDCHSELKYS